MSKSIKHEELRTKKMMSEGSPVLTAYFNESTLDEMRGENEWIAVKAMISEGGLGAEMYY